MSAPDNPQLDPQNPVPDQEDDAPVPAIIPPATELSSTFQAPAIPTPPEPVENPPWSGWDVLLAGLLIFAFVIAFQLTFAKFAQLLWFPHGSIIEAAQALSQKFTVIIAMQIVIYAFAAMLMMVMVEGKYHVPFWQSVRWNWPTSFWRYFGLGAILLLALSILETLLPMPKDTPFDHFFDRPLNAYLLAIIAVTFAPLMEELFFRGFMYPTLARRIGVVWAVVLSALPFALLHLPQYAYAWAAGLVIFIVGIVCGVVRAVSQSVGASFLVHAGYNGTQMLIAVLWTRGFTHMPKGLLQLHG